MADKYQGKLLNAPNDVWIRPDGGVYFTDPFYKRPYWQRGPSEQDQQAVYFLPADGMTLDTAGNVYLTGAGVTVYSNSGKKIEQIDVPEGWTANVCSGGRDMQTLFITASKGLYSLKMNVKGAGRQ
jgi:gluconolactonase